MGISTAFKIEKAWPVAPLMDSSGGIFLVLQCIEISLYKFSEIQLKFAPESMSQIRFLKCPTEEFKNGLSVMVKEALFDDISALNAIQLWDDESRDEFAALSSLTHRMKKRHHIHFSGHFLL